MKIEELIPDNEGNYLLVALDFYDLYYKLNVLRIPEEFSDIEIADISINKIDLDAPLHHRALFKMCDWLLSQFNRIDGVFTFICSIDDLKTNHGDVLPQEYRWRLFNLLYLRAKSQSNFSSICIRDLEIGPEGYRTYARAFYGQSKLPIVNLITFNLLDKES